MKNLTEETKIIFDSDGATLPDNTHVVINLGPSDGDGTYTHIKATNKNWDLAPNFEIEVHGDWEREALFNALFDIVEALKKRGYTYTTNEAAYAA